VLRNALVAGALAGAGLVLALVIPLSSYHWSREALLTSTLFTLLALPTFYMPVHQLRARLGHGG
jgi:hypothetical protein